MQGQPRWCFDKCMVINSCDNAWIINSFYFGYRSPIRLWNNFIYPKWIFWFRNPNKSDLHTSTYYHWAPQNKDTQIDRKSNQPKKHNVATAGLVIKMLTPWALASGPSTLMRGIPTWTSTIFNIIRGWMPLISTLAKMTNHGYAKIIGKTKRSGFCVLTSKILWHIRQSKIISNVACIRAHCNSFTMYPYVPAWHKNCNGEALQLNGLT
jgi:hypothetical protein